MKRSVTRMAVVAALAAAPALLAFSGNAAAAPIIDVARFHLALSKSEPAANDTVAAPKTLKLWFTESVQLAATAVQITGPAKKPVTTGAISIAAVAKAPAVVEIVDALKPGTYTVDWKTMAADGHPNKGTFTFTVGTKAAH